MALLLEAEQRGHFLDTLQSDPVRAVLRRELARRGKSLSQSLTEAQVDFERLQGWLSQSPLNLWQSLRRLLLQGLGPDTHWLLPDLYAAHQDAAQELHWIQADYGYEAGRNLQQGMECFRTAVGALVEGDYEAALVLLKRAQRNLEQVANELSHLRSQQGYSQVASLDHLGHTLMADSPDRVGASATLYQRKQRVQECLQHRFPDPRLRQEWDWLWRPELERWIDSAQDPAQLLKAETWLAGTGSWLERASQQRDYSRIPAWQELRHKMTQLYHGLGTQVAVTVVAKEWKDSLPQSDVDPLKQHHLTALRKYLKDIQDNPLRQEMPDRVSQGDLAYDRWLWLLEPLAKQ